MFLNNQSSDDTNDLILVPESKHEEWSRLLLPQYQYAIFDILFQLELSCMIIFLGICRSCRCAEETYRVVNQHEEALRKNIWPWFTKLDKSNPNFI